MSDPVLAMIDNASREGYNNAEILDYLGTHKPEFASQIKSARDEGYNDDEIMGHLKTQHTAPKTSYLQNVIAGAGKEISSMTGQNIQNLKDLTSINTFGLTGPLQGQSVGENYIGALKNLATNNIVNPIKGLTGIVAGGVQTGTDALVKNLNLKVAHPEIKEDPALIKYREESKPMFEEAKNLYRHPIDSFENSPLTTVMAWAPIAAKGASLTKLGMKGMVEKMAFPGGVPEVAPAPLSLAETLKGISKPNTETGGLVGNLRNPADIGIAGHLDYKTAVKNLSTAFGKIMDNIEAKSPNKVANIDEFVAQHAFSEDPLVQLRIRQSPKFKEAVDLALEGKPVNLKLSDLQKMKNEISGKFAKSKFQGGAKSLDIGQMEMLNDLNKVILNNFEDMKPLYDQYGPVANDLYAARAMRTPEGALDFINNQANDVRVEAAARVLSPEMRSAILNYKKVGNIGIPDKTPIFGGLKIKSLKRNPWNEPRGK